MRRRLPAAFASMAVALALLPSADAPAAADPCLEEAARIRDELKELRRDSG
ncbi:MAG TPA: hypothetical protein VHR18_08680 [Solirubrobacterales bacterium]|nr:hypothetical protein [Solirubrobacterales bacterium]